MNLLESFRIALRALWANKLRAALTMLGIIIGVSAVVSLMSIGRGAQATVTASISQIGTNLIFISPGSTTQSGVRQASGTAPTLTLDDAKALDDPFNAPAIAAVSPVMITFGQVVALGQNVNTRIMGVEPAAQAISSLVVVDGEFISQQQVDANSRVAVLGATVAKTLFEGMSPVGQEIKINGQTFRIIGVLEARGGMAMLNQDDVVLAPITTVMNRLQAQRTARGSRNVSTIYVQAVNEAAIPQAQEQIAVILRERHRLTTGQDDFSITTQEQILGVLNQVTGILTIFLGAVAGISLLVGGIGVMNIMLVSVTERTREIGIRKAVGAKQRDILVQFLIEAVVLSGVGGGIGLSLGFLISRAISALNLGASTTSVGSAMPGLQALVTPDIVILAFSVSAAVGLFFGIYPARRAAQLHPIDALRYE